VKVIDDSRMSHARGGAPELLGNVRVQLREALDVDLVEDRVGHRTARRPIITPVKIPRHEHGARHVRRRVAGLGSAGIVGDVTINGRIPLHLAGHGAPIRVEQQLGGVAADARRWIPGLVHAEAVALARPHVGHVALPDESITLVKPPAGLLAGVVEQRHLDVIGRAAEQGEARPAPVEVGAERRLSRDLKCPVGGFYGHPGPSSESCGHRAGGPGMDAECGEHA
jgi:hypothetical protein